MEDFLIKFENEPISKPRNVKAAIILLVLVISVATVTLFLNLIFADFYTFKVKVSGYLISFALYAFLTFHINARRNWARILYIVWLGIAMIVIPPPIISMLSVSKLSALIVFIKTLLQLAAAVALLTKSANKWFRARV